MPDETMTDLFARYRSERQIAIAYARGRMTVLEERAVEMWAQPQWKIAAALLALVDDRRSIDTQWKL